VKLDQRTGRDTRARCGVGDDVEQQRAVVLRELDVVVVVIQPDRDAITLAPGQSHTMSAVITA
jgi:hypothetical protein